MRSSICSKKRVRMRVLTWRTRPLAMSCTMGLSCRLTVTMMLRLRRKMMEMGSVVYCSIEGSCMSSTSSALG